MLMTLYRIYYSNIWGVQDEVLIWSFSGQPFGK